MREHTLTHVALAAGLALVLGACNDGLTGVNRNSNAPPDVGADFLLPQAIRSAVENTYARMLLAHTSIWSQQTVQIQYPDEERGRVRAGTIQAFWDTLYAGSLKDIQTVIEKGRETQRPNLEAAGLIWKTWTFHQITDLWGDVPYSEALALRTGGGITTPRYDTQQAIYAGLIQTLKDAVALLDPTKSGPGAGDILYGGNVERWRRFANSLRMRLAMRLSEVAPTTAQAEFVAAYNAGGFASNADNAMLAWPGVPYQNPLFENRVVDGRDDDGISATMVDTLKSLNDPRLQLYAEPAEEDGAYRGLGNNIRTPPLSLGWYSRIGNFWRWDGAATPTAIMTYAEVLFLRAEAAARGWTTDDPAARYYEAIRANMTQYAAPAAPTTAEIDAYVVQPRVVYDPATGLAQIQLQKWISLYMQGNEAFANQRRTDIPSLRLGPNLSFRVVRFPYPAGEQSLNSANLMAAVARQGGGLDLITRLWWDVAVP
jgi:SusD/RagB-like outer membrane lipoprotein